MNENNDFSEKPSAPDERLTPFDDPSKMPISSEIDAKPVPDPALWESIAPPEEKVDSGRLPENVKIAGALFIVHGACLALNSFLWRSPDANGALDGNDLLRGLLWLGATFFIASGLFERRIWAWWTATLVGGAIGVMNLLSSIGNVMSGFLFRGEEPIKANFYPPVIAIAAVVMLFSTLLLLTSTAKAAFGITKDNPSGLF